MRLNRLHWIFYFFLTLPCLSNWFSDFMFDPEYYSVTCPCEGWCLNCIQVPCEWRLFMHECTDTKRLSHSHANVFFQEVYAELISYIFISDWAGGQLFFAAYSFSIRNALVPSVGTVRPTHKVQLSSAPWFCCTCSCFAFLLIRCYVAVFQWKLGSSWIAEASRPLISVLKLRSPTFFGLGPLKRKQFLPQVAFVYHFVL